MRKCKKCKYFHIVKELDAKYGVRNKDYFVTMAGTAER